MVPLQTHGCYNEETASAVVAAAVVPLQTHGCYNTPGAFTGGLPAVVPLQTHGCYNSQGDHNRYRPGRGSPTDSRVL